MNSNPAYKTAPLSTPAFKWCKTFFFFFYILILFSYLARVGIVFRFLDSSLTQTRLRCFRRFLPLYPVVQQDLRSLLSTSCECRAPSSNDKMQVAEDSWRLNYVSGDMFSCPGDESLAHCISEDVRMGAGIAVMFKKTFGQVSNLKEQKKLPGECAVLTHNGRFIYYMITKKKASQRPTYENLKKSLEDMKSHCLKNGVKRISMPRIGCGLDRLDWSKVSEILEQVFKDSNISITVYSLPKKAETTVMEENMRK